MKIWNVEYNIMVDIRNCILTIIFLGITGSEYNKHKVLELEKIKEGRIRNYGRVQSLFTI